MVEIFMMQRRQNASNGILCRFLMRSKEYAKYLGCVANKRRCVVLLLLRFACALNIVLIITVTKGLRPVAPNSSRRF